MNIVLIEDPSERQAFKKDDRVYRHVCDTLRMSSGDTFDIGLINGPRGKALIVSLDKESLEVRIEWGEVPENPREVIVLLGLARPQTVQKQLNVLATLGVSKMVFFPTARGEPSYAKSRVWRDGLWKRHVLEGVEQAFATKVPEVEVMESLDAVLDKYGGEPVNKVVMDNYEAEGSLRDRVTSVGEEDPVLVAIGSERGWESIERELFRRRAFTFAHLGPRVLRCETAATLAVSAALGWI